MLKLILQRLAQMVLIMAIVSLILFAVFDSEKFKKQLAVNELGGFAVETLIAIRLSVVAREEGTERPVLRPLCQVGRAASLTAISASPSRRMHQSADCSAVPSLNTGNLAFWVFALMIPLALITGSGSRHPGRKVAGPRRHFRLRGFHFDSRDRHCHHPDCYFRARPRLAAGEVQGRSASNTWSCRC